MRPQAQSMRARRAVGSAVAKASSWIRASTPSVVPTSPDEPLGAGKGGGCIPFASTVEIKSSGATAPV